jgi:hypothetical protein
LYAKPARTSTIAIATGIGLAETCGRRPLGMPSPFAEPITDRSIVPVRPYRRLIP